MPLTAIHSLLRSYTTLHSNLIPANLSLPWFYDAIGVSPCPWRLVLQMAAIALTGGLGAS